jgi:Skp family chaperone for outer membrane proteins
MLKIIASIIALTTTTSAFAEIKIAIVDYTKIESEAMVAKDVRSQIENEHNTIQKNCSKDALEIEKEFKQLQSTAKVLSEAALQKKSSELKSKAETKDKECTLRLSKLEGQKNTAIEKINSHIRSIAMEVSVKDGYHLVIPSSGTIYSNNENVPDITRTVIEKLDSKVSKLDLSKLES